MSFVLSLFMPWWCIALVSFGISAFLLQKPWLAFLSGFLAIALLWGGLAWGISAANNHLLASKIAVLVIEQDNTGLLILATAVIGGLVSGFSAMSGALLRRLF